MFGFLKRLLNHEGRELPPEQARLEKRLEELRFDVDKVAAELAAVTKELAEQPREIRIERVCVDRVNLDQIVFNVDAINVRDLGGSLSIGLNYGGRVAPKEVPQPAPGKPRKAHPDTPPPPPGNRHQVKINFGGVSKEGEQLGRKSQPI
jgi:hypothetical protein